MSTAPTNSNNSAAVAAANGDGAVVAPAVPQQQQQHGKHNECRNGKLVSRVAIFLAFLLIVGAISMHLRQKAHYGRLKFEFGKKDPVELQVVTVPAAAAFGSTQQEQLTDKCLECIAATATANKPAMCNGYPCGIYRISRPYLQDALRAAASIGSEDYESCVSDTHCATEIVRAYLKHYARDCNGDGVIQCRDHVMLHLLGPTGCRENQLAHLYQARMLECLTMEELE